MHMPLTLLLSALGGTKLLSRKYFQWAMDIYITQYCFTLWSLQRTLEHHVVVFIRLSQVFQRENRRINVCSQKKKNNIVETKKWFLKMNINILFSFLHNFENC